MRRNYCNACRNLDRPAQHTWLNNSLTHRHIRDSRTASRPK